MPSRFAKLLTTISLPAAAHGNLSPSPTSPNVFHEDSRDERYCYPGSAFGKIENAGLLRGNMAQGNLMEGVRGGGGGVEGVGEDGGRGARIRGRRRQSLKDAASILVFWKREEKPKSPERAGERTWMGYNGRESTRESSRPPTREKTWMGYRGRESTRESSRPPTREMDWASLETRQHRGTPSSSRPPSRVRCLPEMPPGTPPEPPRKDTPPEKTRTRASSNSSFRSGISTRLRKEMPVVVPPPMGLGVKGDRGRHDSRYSSVASSFEEKRNSSRSSRRLSRPPQDGLSLMQLQSLGVLLNEVQRGLKKQEEVAGAFERNLFYLLHVKERSIKDNHRLNGEWKRGLCRELGLCTEELEKAFTRKNALQARSSDLVRDFLARLGDQWPLQPTEIKSRKRGYLSQLRDRSASRSRPPLSHKRHYSNPVAMQAAPDIITKEAVNTMLGALKKDMESQRLLDDCILDAITRKCWKARWVRSANMRIEMKRFIRFVSGRVEVVKGVEFGIKASMGLISMMLDGESQPNMSRTPSTEKALEERLSRGLDRGKETRRFTWR